MFKNVSLFSILPRWIDGSITDILSDKHFVTEKKNYNTYFYENPNFSALRPREPEPSQKKNRKPEHFETSGTSKIAFSSRRVRTNEPGLNRGIPDPEFIWGVVFENARNFAGHEGRFLLVKKFTSRRDLVQGRPPPSPQIRPRRGAAGDAGGGVLTFRTPRGKTAATATATARSGPRTGSATATSSGCPPAGWTWTRCPWKTWRVGGRCVSRFARARVVVPR